MACLVLTPATGQDIMPREAVQAVSASGPGVWIRLARFQEGQNGLWGWAFNNMTSSRRIVYSFAGGNSGALWRFDTVTNRWTATGAVTGKRHNCTLAHDPVHERVWVSSCAPAENDVWDRRADVNYFRYYDVAGNKWVKQCPTPCGALGGNPGLVFDPIAKKLITFGGWGGGQKATLTYDATAVPGTS
jgi:hypothetical protein